MACACSIPARSTWSRLGAAAGEARGRKQKEHASDQLEARAYAALGELLDSGSATARTQAVRYTLDRLTANSPAGLEAAKKALWLDIGRSRRCRRRGPSSPG